VITEQAHSLGCPLYRYGEEWTIDKISSGFICRIKGKDFDLPHPSLHGRHQYDNAGVAVMIAHSLGIDMSLIRQGIQTAAWPGRLQQVAPRVWLDGAHNQGGAVCLASEVAQWQQRPIILIWSMLEGKDPAKFLQTFQSQQDDIRVIVVPMEGGQPPQELAACAQAQGFQVSTSSSLAEAIMQAQEDFPTASILICGSLYLMKDALTFFKQQGFDRAH
jgi:dihydrofolate synthase/folylpolyglutamate synthase